MSAEHFPVELVPAVKNFQTELDKLKEVLNTLHGVDQSELSNAEHKATLECTSAFALNSLFWMWLVTKGEHPKNHEKLLQELDRVKAAMAQLSELKDKAKRVKLDKPATKRFIQSSLRVIGDEGK